MFGLKGMGERFHSRYTICDIATKIFSPFPISFLKSEQYLRISFLDNPA